MFTYFHRDAFSMADPEEKSTQGSRGEKQTPKNRPKNQTDSPQKIPPNKTRWIYIDLCDSINKYYVYFGVPAARRFTSFTPKKIAEFIQTAPTKIHHNLSWQQTLDVENLYKMGIFTTNLNRCRTSGINTRGFTKKSSISNHLRYYF